MNVKSVMSNLVAITAITLALVSASAHSKTTKSQSNNKILEVVRTQLLEIDPEIFDSLDEEEQDGLTQSALESLNESSSQTAAPASAPTFQEHAEKRPLTMSEIVAASKEYRAYKKTHADDIKNFKKISHAHFKRIKAFAKLHKSISASEATDLENEYLGELEANKIKIGLKLDCSIDWAMQLFVLNLSSSERCFYSNSSQTPSPKYDVEFWGIGPGIGIQGAEIGTVCLLDNRFKNLKSVNVGLRGNASFVIGVNGGLSFGMNGVCASYGIELGAGVGLAVGAFTVTQK